MHDSTTQLQLHQTMTYYETNIASANREPIWKEKQGHKLTRIPATVKVDDILCLLESEREARRLR
ncbi:uncharacterized protein ASPGLDRAFT_50728 [Aspergillus glaucus CBS 516.65]|uniref:Uncharacterized protein n=1 Tax=Aspergillus glaucus CBS 516.65 TaxID=1160497 RepID=A0A1L9VB86_ASPGL|nr:hypothetical protein ASPGLDRAFT_50728 [Aspergillus glaucus CBS 516.65]OJJ81196.1 hypothetical protein ASPGLDRAFT_50728 [Aspergillus glaucus CBS 516.65]